MSEKMALVKVKYEDNMFAIPDSDSEPDIARKVDNNKKPDVVFVNINGYNIPEEFVDDEVIHIAKKYDYKRIENFIKSIEKYDVYVFPAEKYAKEEKVLKEKLSEPMGIFVSYYGIFFTYFVLDDGTKILGKISKYKLSCEHYDDIHANCVWDNEEVLYSTDFIYVNGIINTLKDAMNKIRIKGFKEILKAISKKHNIQIKEKDNGDVVEIYLTIDNEESYYQNVDNFMCWCYKGKYAFFAEEAFLACYPNTGCYT